MVVSIGMNEASYEAAKKLLSAPTYVQQGRDARRTHEKHIQMLLQQVSLTSWSGFTRLVNQIMHLVSPLSY